MEREREGGGEREYYKKTNEGIQQWACNKTCMKARVNLFALNC